MVLMVNVLFKSINKVNILKDLSFSIYENEILNSLFVLKTRDAGICPKLGGTAD